jgi:hypothetical protein
MSTTVPPGAGTDGPSAGQNAEHATTITAPAPDTASAHDLTGPSSDPASAYEAVLAGYSNLFAPVGETFEQLARMAALIFGVPIVSVNIARDVPLWFPVSEGPDGAGPLVGPSPSADLTVTSAPGRAQQPLAPYVITDTAADARTREHPWVAAKNGIRFLAVAAIVSPDGYQLGTLEVLDRKPHRVSAQQMELLAGLGATIAQLLNQRVSALATLRAADDEHAADLRLRDTSDRRIAEMNEAATAARNRLRPQWCQLGGTESCREPAELKVADSWGDSAWGCWTHAEDALMQVPSVFLATVTAPVGLEAYRHRTRRPEVS